MKVKQAANKLTKAKAKAKSATKAIEVQGQQKTKFENMITFGKKEIVPLLPAPLSRVLISHRNCGENSKIYFAHTQKQFCALRYCLLDVLTHII